MQGRGSMDSSVTTPLGTKLVGVKTLLNVFVFLLRHKLFRTHFTKRAHFVLGVITKAVQFHMAIQEKQLRVLLEIQQKQLRSSLAALIPPMLVLSTPGLTALPLERKRPESCRSGLALLVASLLALLRLVLPELRSQVRCRALIQARPRTRRMRPRLRPRPRTRRPARCAESVDVGPETVRPGTCLRFR